MTRFAKHFYLLVALQVAVILALILVKQATLWTGQRILLRTIPVDPRDLFRGEYVALRYEISEIPSGRMQEGRLGRGETVYVALRREGRFWVVDGVSRRPPADAAAFLRGQVTDLLPERRPTNGPYEPATCRVAYGIESWFVPRGQGRALEEAGRRPDRQLIVEAAVDRNGKAVLRQVRVEPRAPSR